MRANHQRDAAGDVGQSGQRSRIHGDKKGRDGCGRRSQREIGAAPLRRGSLGRARRSVSHPRFAAHDTASRDESSMGSRMQWRSAAN